jgi:glycosyltransferase involved in cell wall biosynthesis
LFGFQPYEDLPDMLATADIVLVLLEPEAGAFSVPSKVLTYHCAGRPILGAMPAENLASRIIESNRSGIVVEPDDAAAFVAAAHLLVDDPDLRATMGRSGRRYAETTFDIERIGDRFVEVLGSVGIVVTGPGGVGSR